jgi:hypothetical protein
MRTGMRAGTGTHARARTHTRAHAHAHAAMHAATAPLHKARTHLDKVVVPVDTAGYEMSDGAMETLSD